MNRFARAIRNFTRRGQLDVLDALRAQAAAAEEAGRLCAVVVTEQDPPDDVADRVRDVEHDGDAAHLRVTELLAVALAVPIDREDVARLSRSIDDVVDNLRDFVVEHELYRGGDDAGLLQPVIERVRGGVAELRGAVDGLEHGVRDAEQAADRIRGNGVRDAYQRAMAELLEGEVTAQTLQQRELLRRLDIVGLRLGEAADALFDGALKRRA